MHLLFPAQGPRVLIHQLYSRNIQESGIGLNQHVTYLFLVLYLCIGVLQALSRSFSNFDQFVNLFVFTFNKFSEKSNPMG